MKKVFLVSVIIFILSVIGNKAFAISQAELNGLNYLSTTQNPGGSWSGEHVTDFYSTFTVLETFRLFSKVDASYQMGFQWSQSYPAENIDYLTKRIILLSQNNISPTDELAILLSLRDIDTGGWGLKESFLSEIIDTSLALQALKAVNYSDQNVVYSAINYLISNQNTDGGWGFYKDDISNVYMTAMVSMTLQQFPRTTSIATAINKATSYLIAHQKADGGFGSSSSTVYETALSYIALLGVTTDNTVLGNAINYLINTQMPNGSWLQDPYSTALALRALYFSQNKPVPPPASTTGTVTGKVVDASTNQPLGGVAVVSGQLSATTTDMGTFTISNIPAGEQTITFTLNGYATATATVNITAGSIISLGTIPLSQSPTTGIIKGTVTDASNGQPLSDVTITVTGSFSGSTVTGTDGAFIFTNVTPGAVTITASKTGYYSVTGTGTVVAGGILFFNPQLSTSPPVQTTGNLTGKVFDGSTNTPIQGATVSISGGPSTTTDASGVFLIKDITPNTYQAIISATGYISQVYQVMILAGVTTDMQTIYLTPAPQATTITGKVTDAQTGNPISGADVIVVGSTLSAKTDSAGVYTILGISLLEFALKASATGYDSKSYTMTTTTYGTYTVDFSLNPSKMSDLRIVSLSTDKESYPANTDVIITATIENNGSASIDAFIVAYINDNQGNAIAITYPTNREITINPLSSANVNITWNTCQFSPGYYEIILKVMDAATVDVSTHIGNILVEKAVSFSITPSVSVNGEISFTPSFTYTGATETVTMNLLLLNKSNISADLMIEHVMKTPSSLILNTGSTPVVLTLDYLSKKITLSTFTYNFTESGEYPIDVVIYNEGTIMANINSVFTVLSNIRIEPSKSVTPATVLPDGSGKVRITIELKGVEAK